MFNFTKDELVKQKAIHTAQEIFQQPEVWQKFIADLGEKRESYKDFLDSIYAEHDLIKVIFTGAGTSAFTGDTILPELREQAPKHVIFESIPTTDIVSNPTKYFQGAIPTILVSFARSGDSPESVATVNLGKQLIKDFYQVVITCNKDGQLAANVKGDEKSLLIVLPDEAHDQGFAMTSSFTTMALAAYVLFSKNGIQNHEINYLTKNAQQLLNTVADKIDVILETEFDRIVFLGSGALGQLAHEASLKMLELTAGKVAAMFETSLGFRHGPKSILNDKSMVVLFMSQDSYTRKYDLDILKEISIGSPEVVVIALSENHDEEVARLADWTIAVNSKETHSGSDFSLALLYIIFGQVMALKKSLQLGITPDNPSPDGRVNRVVQGVTIYPFEK